MKDRGKVFFRADGNSTIGLGHVIRSLALAEMLKDEFECHFLIVEPLSKIRLQILSVCHNIITLPKYDSSQVEITSIIQNYLEPDDIVVLDGYVFDTEYQKQLKKNGCKIVCIDDIHAFHFVADVIINHAGDASKEDYSTEIYTQFCLGLDYALLRKSFRQAAKINDYPHREYDSIFICLGGADPNNDCLEVLETLRSYVDINKCYLVLGAAYIHSNVLNDYLSNYPKSVELLSSLNEDEMVYYMQRCSFSITSPSTISYEYLSVGGLLFLKTTADNQSNIYRFLINNKFAFDISNLLDMQNLNETNVLEQRRKPFDGNQEKRFLKLFRSLDFKARKATLGDMLTYFDWTNDPSTRSQSFNSDMVSIEDHEKWFKERISSAKSIMYIVELDNQLLGQIRFDITKVATISYSIDKKNRGQGLGESLLRKGIAMYRSESEVVLPIVGYVKKSNIASIKSFRAIGFKELESQEYKESLKFIL